MVAENPAEIKRQGKNKRVENRENKESKQGLVMP
jgi:hypothetical protein